jgi:hypothetical protein
MPFALTGLFVDEISHEIGVLLVGAAVQVQDGVRDITIRKHTYLIFQERLALRSH